MLSRATSAGWQSHPAELKEILETVKEDLRHTLSRAKLRGIGSSGLHNRAKEVLARPGSVSYILAEALVIFVDLVRLDPSQTVAYIETAKTWLGKLGADQIGCIFPAKHVSTIVNKTAHLCKSRPASEKEVMYRLLLAKFEQPLLVELFDQASARDSRVVANILWGLAKLGVQCVDLKVGTRRILLVVASRLALYFETQHVANILWALATMGFTWEALGTDLQSALLAAIKSQVTYFNRQGIANMLWALATMRCTWEVLGTDLQNALLIAVLMVVNSSNPEARFNPQELANTLWGLARLGFRWEHLENNLRLRDALLAAILEATNATTQAARFSPQNLANVLLALATMGCKWEYLGANLQRAFLAAVLGAVNAGVPAARFNAQELANTLWALALMEFRWDSLDLASQRAISAAVTRLAPHFNSQNLANVLWAFARLERRWDTLEPDLRGALVRAAIRLAPGLDPQSVANIVWAFAKLGRRWDTLEGGLQKALLAAVLKAALKTVDVADDQDAFDTDDQGSFTAQGIANTCWGLAAMEFPWADLTEIGDDFQPALLAAVTRLALRLDTQELTSILLAFSKLGIKWKDLGDDLQSLLLMAIKTRATHFNAQDVANMFLALATMELPWMDLDDDFQQLLLAAVDRLAPRFTSQNRANTVWALMIFHSKNQVSSLEACAQTQLLYVHRMQPLPVQAASATKTPSEEILTEETAMQFAMADLYFKEPGAPEPPVIKNFHPKKPDSSSYHKKVQRQLIQRLQEANPNLRYVVVEEYRLLRHLFVDIVIAKDQFRGKRCFVEVIGDRHKTINDAAKKAIIEKHCPQDMLCYIEQNWRNFEAVFRAINATLKEPTQPQSAPSSQTELLDKSLPSSPPVATALTQAIPDLLKKTKKKKRKPKNHASTAELLITESTQSPSASLLHSDPLALIATTPVSPEKPKKKKCNSVTGTLVVTGPSNDDSLEAVNSTNRFLVFFLALVGGLVTADENTSTQTAFGLLTILCLICQTMRLAGALEPSPQNKSMTDLTDHSHADLAQQSSRFFESVRKKTEAVPTSATLQLTH